MTKRRLLALAMCLILGFAFFDMHKQSVQSSAERRAYLLYNPGDIVRVRGVNNDVLIRDSYDRGQGDYSIQYADDLGKMQYATIYQNMITGRAQ